MGMERSRGSREGGLGIDHLRGSGSTPRVDSVQSNSSKRPGGASALGHAAGAREDRHIPASRVPPALLLHLITSEPFFSFSSEASFEPARRETGLLGYIWPFTRRGPRPQGLLSVLRKLLLPVRRALLLFMFRRPSPLFCGTGGLRCGYSLPSGFSASAKCMSGFSGLRCMVRSLSLLGSTPFSWRWGPGCLQLDCHGYSCWKHFSIGGVWDRGCCFSGVNTCCGIAGHGVAVHSV